MLTFGNCLWFAASLTASERPYVSTVHRGPSPANREMCPIRKSMWLDGCHYRSLPPVKSLYVNRFPMTCRTSRSNRVDSDSFLTLQR